MEAFLKSVVSCSNFVENGEVKPLATIFEKSNEKISSKINWKRSIDITKTTPQ